MRLLTTSLICALIYLYSYSGGYSQVVKDPLLHFFSVTDNSTHRMSRVNIYEIETDQFEEGSHVIMLTSDALVLGPHGDCAWSLYRKRRDGYYTLISTPSTFIDAGTLGPDYIGYIPELHRLGAITGSNKYGIFATYVENGVITTVPIDSERGHADPIHFPKYFSEKGHDYHLTIYTLDQLAEKYSHPDPGNVITPAAK